MIAKTVSRAASLAALLIALPALADTREEANEQAKPHFRRGVTLYAEQDYRAALIEFKRAYQISPSYAVLFNIGQSSYQLLDYASALRALERYLAEGDKAIPAARRDAVEKEIAELRERVATLTVRTNVEDAEITIDDEPVGRSPLASALTVGAGRRKVVASKSGRAPVVRYVDLAGGDSAVVVLEIAEPTRAIATAPPIAASPEPPVIAPAPAARTSPLAYVGFGVAALGVGVGATFGAFALSEKSALDGLCVDQTCGPRWQRRINHMQEDATISTIGFGVGAVGLVTGVYFLLTAPHRSTESNAAAHIEPWLGAGSGGVRGTF